MDAFQLPLLDELVAIHPAIAQPRATGKFQAPSQPAEALALFALLSSPMPVEHLQRIACIDNETELLTRLRGLGLMLPCAEVPELDATGRLHIRTVCALTPADARRVTRWLKKHGGGRG